MFCFHKWKLHSKKITKSMYEQMKSQGFICDRACPKDFEKELIVIFQCQKCGLYKQKIFNSEALIE